MDNVIKVEQNLLKLAKIFNKSGAKLYIVGGFVRNALLGFCETDIDICSGLLPEEVFKLLYNTDFGCVLVNEKLGTIHIFEKNNKKIVYEHTTFRAETYSPGGGHRPNNISFVSDIRLDASRRDFSCNALYYDILDNKILDFYNGQEDTKKRVLKTVETPQKVFSCDGLRILRMVRIASELDFSIDDNTFKTAQNMIKQLADISQERFNKEIIAMLFADYKYEYINNPSAHIRALNIMSELGAWQYVLKDFWSKLLPEQRTKLQDINWQMLDFATPALRISSFVCCLISDLNLSPSMDIINSILGIKGIMLNKKECAKQQKIVSAFVKIKQNSFANDKECRLFIQENYEYINEIWGLCKINSVGQNIIKIYELMTIDRAPLCLKDLAINGQDLLEIYPELPRIYYSKVLAYLLSACASLPEMNEKDKLLFMVPDAFLKIEK